MRKIFLSMMAIALFAGVAFATNDGGGKKKARKKAKTECKKENCPPKCCNPQSCNPGTCAPGSGNSNCVDMKSAMEKGQCPPANCQEKK